MSSLDAIKNFVAITDSVGTGGQPTDQQLRAVASSGYQCVVNLGLLDPKYCLPDEEGLASSLSLAYHHLPVRFDAPQVADVEAFVRVMDAHAGERVFIHCAANYRVSTFAALYGQLRWQWSVEQADAHARRFWPLNETWSSLIAQARQKLGLPG